METIREAGKISMPTGWHYSGIAVLLHWLLALLIAGMVGLGWYMMAIEDESGADRYFNLHKSIGIVIFALVLIRAIWRINHKPAELPASLPKWEVMMASIVQWLLYGGMILLPVTGFIGALYSKSGVIFFGASFPAWILPNYDTAERFFEVHEALTWTLVILVAIHTAAGIKHLILNRDRVFQRMWF